MDHIKISAKNLGVVALKNFCPRCYWIKLKLENKLPWQSFPGIFSSIDAYTKHCVHYMIDRAESTKQILTDTDGKNGIIVKRDLPRWMTEIGNVVGYETVPHWSKSKYTDDKTNITLSGAPDDIWVLDSGKKVIPDYKTAKHTNTQDELFPMYEIQENVYSLLLARDAALYLIYMEPMTEKGFAIENITDAGFKMGFNAVVVPVVNDRRIIRAALNLTREIYEERHAPDAADGCKECAALDAVIEKVSVSAKDIVAAERSIQSEREELTEMDHCEKCGKAVKNGELVGLFVPSLCAECEQKRADDDRRTGNVCGLCRQPRSRCCC
jgi:hypothetical protein